MTVYSKRPPLDPKREFPILNKVATDQLITIPQSPWAIGRTSSFLPNFSGSVDPLSWAKRLVFRATSRRCSRHFRPGVGACAACLGMATHLLELCRDEKLKLRKLISTLPSQKIRACESANPDLSMFKRWSRQAGK